MACDLELGRLEPCKDVVGGITSVYFINYTSGLLDTATFDADDQITAFASPLTLYQYEMKGANGLEEANENSRETGTSFWTQTITASLKKLSAEYRKELKLMAYGRPQVIVQDYNGNYLMCGIENGVEVSVSPQTGAAMGDLSGYVLSGIGTEKEPAFFVSSAIIGDTTNTVVVVGTNT